ncbi:hypothetical protein [Enterovirga rhinocerotis]|uniref:Membrane protein DUF2157 n=1 Tax=Enterovirga rhinocerotis TaxID=1339210 RepID=A0A4R7BX31_9HYPH|nr:hypothetical protein [Enterovirga rhinocerotis]TDR89762.1 hypothetical protein EV668_2597 [Enterovirga rhinocerotis]
MISARVLDLAVEKGLVSDGQRLALLSLAREVEGPVQAPPVDEERLRFITGFADIFVTMGIALFLGAAMYLIGMSLPPAAGLALLAAMSWGLAEFFTRRRRMALPSIVLLAIFVCSAFMALSLFLGAQKGSSFLALWAWGWGRGWGIGALPNLADARSVALAAIGTSALAALHYWRFRVPITIAAGVSALSLAAITLLMAAAPQLMAASATPIVFGLGLAIFALAMRFDLSDPLRETRRTDIAFWLHLLAAPMIVHSVFQAVGATQYGIGPASAALVLAIFAILAAVAILVDRRALLVSGLVYAGWAFASLFRTIGFNDYTGPVTVLLLGAFVLVLSAGWTPLRAAVVSRLGPAWAARLPPHAPR